MRAIIITILATITLSILSLTTANGQLVGKYEKGPFILKNGTLHTVSNGTMKADLMIKDGKIEAIGQNLSDSDATVIDCQNKHIYPGLIDGGTYLGLAEISSISLSKDHRELGDFTPHMQALTAVNPSSVNIPVTRTNGVTSAVAMPSGGLFPGTASLIHLFGYTPQQMAGGFEGVVLNFPSTARYGRWDRRTDEEIEKSYKEKLEKLNGIWDKVMTYAKIDSAAAAQNKKIEDFNPQMKALMSVIKGDAYLMVNANKKSDIEAAIEWITKRNIKKPILTGVLEGYRIASKIAGSAIPVITGPVLTVPGRDEAAYDSAYRNAAILKEAGVQVAIRTMETENVRNLPFNAGYAATYGLGREGALRAITLSAAEIMGVDKYIGSLDEGKIANIFVSEGDPFEPRDNVIDLFIYGYRIPIENRHILLYQEFLERSPGLEK